MNVSRRRFITGTAALAAFAVTPALVKLCQTDRERLLEQMRTGEISHQFFHFTDGRSVEFRGVRDLYVHHCHFLWTDKQIQDNCLIYFHSDCVNLNFSHNVLRSKVGFQRDWDDAGYSFMIAKQALPG
jgi:hypothetical protein